MSKVGSSSDQCKKPFVDTSGTFAIKTFGMKDVTEKSGTIKKYMGNIYLHHIQKCLYNCDSEFCFAAVNFPEKKKRRKHLPRGRLNLSDTV